MFLQGTLRMAVLILKCQEKERLLLLEWIYLFMFNDKEIAILTYEICTLLAVHKWGNQHFKTWYIR